MILEDAIHTQATITVGLIGSVSNGKSTITKALTGAVTQRHMKEKTSNKTMRVGYANAKIFKCNNCDEPECYQSCASSEVEHICSICDSETELLKHISFTDVPGHNLLMATMLNGTCVMDYVILVESCGNDIIPSQQTIEHYEITRKLGIPTIMICLNKTDLLLKNPQKIKQIMNNLQNFIKEKENIYVPVIPISGTLNCNIDVLSHYLTTLPAISKTIESCPKMFTIRSFNVNHPKTVINELKGGVIGGCLERGILHVGDEMSLCPGYIEKRSQNEKDNTGINWNYVPIKCKVLSIDSEKNELQYAIPGGLIGVQLNIDPAMTGNDRIVGHVLFNETEYEKFKVYEGLKIKYTKIRDIDIANETNISININSNNIKCTIFDSDNEFIKLELESPVCVEHNNKVTISVPSINGCMNIFASGNVVDGIESVKIV